MLLPFAVEDVLVVAFYAATVRSWQILVVAVERLLLLRSSVVHGVIPCTIFENSA